MDCSYGSYDKPLADCWDKLKPFVARGPLLLPIPANGRGPELALEFLRRGRTDIFVDNAMDNALRDLADSATASVRADAGDDIKQLIDTIKPIDGPRGIMLAGSADGTSGATARLFRDWQNQPEPAIVFTGYVNPTTPADHLVKSGRAQFLRWNVHPRLPDTAALVRATQATTVIPAFCDRSQLAPLAAAFAPARVHDGRRNRNLRFRCHLRRQRLLGRIHVDQRIAIEMGRDDVSPFVEDAVQGVVALNVEYRDRAAAGARIDVPAYPACLIATNPRPERLPGLRQLRWPLRPWRRDDEKQHDRPLRSLHLIAT